MTDDESPGLGLDLPEEPPKPAAASPYRVLARKYRPQSFEELIGQNGPPPALGLSEDEIFGLFRIQARPRRG